MSAQFRSAVLFVRDMAASRHFYEHLLCQKVDMNFGVNVGYVGGLSLWDVQAAAEVVFHRAPDGGTALGRDNLEIYFETEDLEAMLQLLTTAGVKLVHPIVEHPWAQRALRAYDPDGHIVELGEPMQATVRRLAAGGLSKEEIQGRTYMPLPAIEQMLAGEATG
ncbi:MAG: glyoxalase [Chloroflexi bacterium]|nr:MAG: glyoxalase [Chloroflexota bacterium]